ncbi:hypothetical protein [Sphingomonas mali]|jgi:hypothetical protein|uniref:hypothetical protein n=1 Tax=Sphingomonas mali TaxID=40682 RepID=UPI00082D3B71|nr:hypothetical protein [Sphingomonas mali]
MVLFKSAVAALASVALAATPALAQAAPAKGTVMAKVSTVRAGADAKDGNHLNGSGTIVAVLAVIAIIGGIVAATSGSSKPKSP